jgi:hypothetical protein
VLSSLFIVDVLSYSSVGWYDDESVLLAQYVCLCGLGGTTSFAYWHVDKQTWSKKIQSKTAYVHQIFILSYHKSR